MLQYKISRLEKEEATAAIERARKMEADVIGQDDNYSNAILTTSRLMKEVFKGTYIWNDEENKSISGRSIV